MKKTIKTIFIKNGDSTLVHFHGFTSFKEENSVLINWCSENNINFAGIDFPGQGETEIDEKDKPSMDYLVGVAISFVRSLNSKNIIISGHSMGGAIAILVANALGKEIVKNIILEDPVNPCFIEDEEKRIKLLNILKEKDSYSRFINNKSELVSMDDKRLKWYKELATNMLDINFLNKVKNSFENTNVKTTIIFGEEDQIVPYIDSLKYFKSIRNDKINFIDIKNAKHVVHNDNPEDYLKVLNSIR